jgi:Glycosyl transferase family 11
MIIVRIVGGLTSQLHKYAVGRALALRLGTELKLDLDWFENPPPADTTWPYQLDKFSLVAGVAASHEVRRVRGHPIWNRLAHRVNRQLNHPWLSSREVNIGTISSGQWAELTDNVYLFGETGGDVLFRQIRSTLLQEFQLRQPWSAKAGQYAVQMQASAYPVSLHVRRGDFITNPYAAQFHVLTGLDYFRQAVDVVLRARPNAQFFVFSDDLAWVTKHLQPILPAGSATVSSLAAEEDLVLMSRCHGNIICNSGFSWTAAWLNDAPNRMVVSPSCWLKDAAKNAEVMKTMHRADWLYI